MRGAARWRRVSRGGDAAPAATTRRAASSACGAPGRCGEAASKDSAPAATQEEPPTSVWQLCQRSVRAAALRRRLGHGAAWIEGDQRLPRVSTRWSWSLLVESRQALPARPPPAQGPAKPPSAGPWGSSRSTGPGDSHAGRHYDRRPSGAFRIGPNEVQSACDAHECPPCGRARSVAVGGTAWGSWVCGTAWSDNFYGEHGSKYIERRSRGVDRCISRV